MPRLTKAQLLASATPDKAPIAWTPDDGQRTALKFLLQHRAAGLLLDPGFGKTAITLAAHHVLMQKKLARRMLVIAPLRVVQLVWQQEVHKWKDFNYMRMVRLHSDYGKMAELAQQDADIFVMNPEGLPWLLRDNNWRTLDCEVLCIDELSKFKHSNTQRFKMLKPLLNTFGFRWGLTGSPAPKGYLNLFGQAFVLDQGRTLGQYITHYRKNFFVPTGYLGYDWQLKTLENSSIDGAKAVQEAIKPLFLRLDMPASAKVPSVRYSEMFVDLPKAARVTYEAMERDFFAEVAKTKNVVLAVNGGAASIKCRQIANGGVYTETKNLSGHKIADMLHNEKTEALLELLEELQGSPLLVAYQFDHDLERIRKALGVDVPYIGGGVSTARTVELERKWNRGELPYLFAQPTSISHGANLQGAGNQVAWYGLTWNFEEYDQFNRRVRRRGNKHAVVYVHHIMARNTIEHAMLATLQGDHATQQELMNALLHYNEQRVITKVPKRR